VDLWWIGESDDKPIRANYVPFSKIPIEEKAFAECVDRLKATIGKLMLLQ
jgi:hypothetical protein